MIYHHRNNISLGPNIVFLNSSYLELFDRLYGILEEEALLNILSNPCPLNVPYVNH